MLPSLLNTFTRAQNANVELRGRHEINLTKGIKANYNQKKTQLRRELKKKLRFLCVKFQSNISCYLYTARKNGFALSLIRIKGVVKCNNSFDTTFDAHQIISQICDAFTYTFDSNQR